MKTISVRAHFDGERILLDEPFEMSPNTPLLVTILSETDADREDWLRLSAARLETAYGPDEPEYSLSSVRELNPHFD